MSKFDSIGHSYKGKSYKDYPDYRSVDYDTCFSTEESIFDIGERIDSLISKFALFKIRQIIIDEMQKSYYKDITNISEVIDVDTHEMEKFVGGVDYMHVENLIIWKNGFYSFNRFNFPIPFSAKKENCEISSIISKKRAYSNKCK